MHERFATRDWQGINFLVNFNTPDKYTSSSFLKIISHVSSRIKIYTRKIFHNQWHKFWRVLKKFSKLLEHRRNELVAVEIFLVSLAPRDANLDRSSKTLHKAPTRFLFFFVSLNNKRLPQNLTYEFVLFSYRIASRRDRIIEALSQSFL